jgi:flagellar biosynthesis protein FlhF
MKIKRFVAKDIRLAMRMVKDELGADAVIMSNRSVDEGVEIVAAKDFDEQIIHQKLSAQTDSSNKSLKPKKTIELTNFDAEKNDLHIISSSRKVNVDGSIPKRSMQRNLDQYAGYAEKIYVAGEKNKKVTKHKSIQQPPVVKPLITETKQQNVREASVSDRFMLEMRQEIQSLKTTLDSKLSEVSWNQTVQNNPVRIDLIHRLADMGFSIKVVLKIANSLDSHENSDVVFAKARQMLTNVLPLSDDNLLQDGGFVAVVGPTGVGKTTTIA